MLGLGLSISSEDSSTNGITLLVSALGARLADDGGTIENPSCMQQDLADLVAEATPFTTGLLEFYPGAAAAYSLRQLRRSVFPYAIRVRRSGDSLEQDIGFNSNGELDTNALLDFANGGDAWVATWYDQSSNGNDATQGTDDDQPQIVSSGSLITENGLPTVQFTDSRFEVGSTDLYGQTDFDAYIAYATSDNSYILFGDSYSSGYFSYVINSSEPSTSLQSGYNGTSLYINGTEFPFTGSTTREDLHDACVQGTMTLEVHQGHTTSSWVDFKISAYNGRRLTGNVSEIILYNSDQSANRTGIEGNINDFYSIYS